MNERIEDERDEADEEIEIDRAPQPGNTPAPGETERSAIEPAEKDDKERSGSE